MDNEEKAKEILECEKCHLHKTHTICDNCFDKGLLLKIAQWKDEQYKTAYVVTRSEEHCDYVEKVFFDKKKAEEYCKPFNEDENSYHRDITKIEVSL